MKWLALIVIGWLLFIFALSFYNSNKSSCQDLGGEYIFTDGKYQCQKELP